MWKRIKLLWMLKDHAKTSKGLLIIIKWNYLIDWNLK